MQLNYEYTATLVYMNGGAKIPIDQAMIRSIIINKEFDRLTMPTITMELQLDRTMADTIINNKKTATFMLSMNKIQTNGVSQAIQENYFTDEFIYLIEDDVDKYASVRYSDPDKNDKEENADKFKPVKLGLISKTASDLARKPNNVTVYNSNMQDIVVSLLNNGAPLLIEPFNYNENIDQMILPPKDSITKVLEYLNKVKVFYSTGYRFFMDLDAMYLVSKGGTPTPKKNEHSAIVNIIVKTIDKESALVRGIEKLDNSYSITIEAGNTDLDTSDITDLQVDSITAVVDASKQKQWSFLAQQKGFGGLLGTYNNVMKTIDNIQKAAGQVRKTLKNIHKATYDIKSRLIDLKEVATEFQSTTKGLIVEASNTINALPEEAKSVLNKKYPGLLKDLLAQARTIDGCYNNTIDGTVDDMNRFTKAFTKQIYNIEDTKGLTGGITPVLFGDNVSSLNKVAANFTVDQKFSEQHLKGSLGKLSTDYDKYNGAIGNVKDILAKLPDILEYKVPVSKPNNSGFGGAVEYITKTIDLRTITSFLPQVQEAHTDTSRRLQEVNKDKEDMSKSVTVNKNVSNELYNRIDNIKNIPIDFKTKFLEGGNNAINKAKEITKTSSSEIKGIGAQLKGDINSLTDSFNAIKDSATLAIDSLGDISAVGEDGESMVTVALAEIAEDLAKRKIIRLPNDNVNILKNIKHSLDLRKSRIKVHKMELDNSIIAINKRYVVTFEGTNTNYSGDYLLMSSQEVYSNQGTQFMANTFMTLAKLPKKS